MAMIIFAAFAWRFTFICIRARFAKDMRLKERRQVELKENLERICVLRKEDKLNQKKI